MAPCPGCPGVFPVYYHRSGTSPFAVLGFFPGFLPAISSQGRGWPQAGADCPSIDERRGLAKTTTNPA